MFEITLEEKKEIDIMHNNRKAIEDQLIIEDKRIKKEWLSFVTLIKSYIKYVKISSLSNIIKFDYHEYKIVYSINDLYIAIDYGLDNYYIFKQEPKKFMCKELKYKKLADIETWSYDDIHILSFDINYLTEIENLFHDMKNSYKEKIENEIQKKTIEFETLKLIYPNFS